MDIILSILVVLGVGNLIATYVSFRLNKKQFIYEMKLKAYQEFLEVLSDSIDDSSKNQKVVYQSQLLRLHAPEKISLTANEFFRDGNKFLEVREKLISQMKNDLEKSY